LQASRCPRSSSLQSSSHTRSTTWVYSRMSKPAGRLPGEQKKNPPVKAGFQ
jgi:hypothetical protein